MVIKFNNWKILVGMVEVVGLFEDCFMDMIIVIDKFDKIGMDGVK